MLAIDRMPDMESKAIDANMAPQTKTNETTPPHTSAPGRRYDKAKKYVPPGGAVRAKQPLGDVIPVAPI